MMSMKRFWLLLTLTVSMTTLKGQVGFNNPTPDPSSLLDLSANDKGLLVPRMTSAQRAAISSPGQSLLVFDTNKQGFYFYTGGNWFALNEWVKNASSNDVSLTGNASVTGNISASSLSISGFPSNPLVPTGIIVMWSGSIGTIPSGWALCNGGNGTPNLTDRFIVAAGSTYNPGNTGGANTVSLSLSEIPSHSHTGTTDLTGSHTHTHEDDFSYVNTGWNSQFPGSYLNAVGTFSGQGTSEGPSNRFAGRNKNTGSSGNHTHNFTTTSIGGSAAHENRPLYYSLAYIMKL